MTVKIDGTNGIDTAQLRAPDGDPVAMTIGNDGVVAFPAQEQSLTGNGYVKLPGGLIIQWGSINVPAGGVGLAFPIPFSTNVFSFVATAQGSQNDMKQTIAPANLGLGGGSLYVSNAAGSDTGGFVRWIAIGY